jgi:FtsH-binding integral membrane protein
MKKSHAIVIIVVLVANLLLLSTGKMPLYGFWMIIFFAAMIVYGEKYLENAKKKRTHR